MPRRTVTCTLIQYHRRYKPNDVKDVAKLPDGADLLTLFHGFLLAAKPDRMVNHEKERYTALRTVDPAGRTILMTTAVGHFGEEGANRNVTTHKEVHSHGGDEAPTIDTRTLLAVPKSGSAAVLFIERASGMGGGSELLRLFHLVWRRRYPDWTLKTQTLVETEAWLAQADLEAVTAVMYGWNADVADSGLPKVVGDLRHVLEPSKGQMHLPRALWNRLRDNSLNKARLLGLPDDAEPDEVVVRLSRDGKTKSFVLGQERQPPVRYLLCDVGDPVPGNEALRNFCSDRASDLFEPVGVDWHNSWKTGSWSQEDLSVRVEVPDE